jgi:hypothetical protein
VCRLQVILGIGLQQSRCAIANKVGVVNSRSRELRAWSTLELVFSSGDYPYFREYLKQRSERPPKAWNVPTRQKPTNARAKFEKQNKLYILSMAFPVGAAFAARARARRVIVESIFANFSGSLKGERIQRL